MALKRSAFEALPSVKIDCAFLPCPVGAVMRLRRPTGWAAVCRMHAEQIWSREAAAFVDQLGLKTAAEKRDWCMARLRDIGKMPPSKKWAYDLLARRDRGESITPLQEEMAERATQGRAGLPERTVGEDDEVTV